MRTDDYVYMYRKLERFTNVSFLFFFSFPIRFVSVQKTLDQEKQNDKAERKKNMEIINKQNYNHLNLFLSLV